MQFDRQLDLGQFFVTYAVRQTVILFCVLSVFSGCLFSEGACETGAVCIDGKSQSFTHKTMLSQIHGKTSYYYVAFSLFLKPGMSIFGFFGFWYGSKRLSISSFNWYCIHGSRNYITHRQSNSRTPYVV